MSKLDYKTIGRKAGVLRKQFEAFGNMVDMEESFHDTLGAAQDKLIAEGVSSSKRNDWNVAHKTMLLLTRHPHTGFCFTHPAPPPPSCTGRAPDGMSELRQAGLKYIDGQRAEARWKFGGSAATLDFYERTASTSDQMLRFMMEFRMGWQKVPYERCV